MSEVKKIHPLVLISLVALSHLFFQLMRSELELTSKMIIALLYFSLTSLRSCLSMQGWKLKRKGDE